MLQNCIVRLSQLCLINMLIGELINNMYVHASTCMYMTFTYAYMYVAHRALLAFRRHAYVDGQACATVVNHCHRVQGLVISNCRHLSSPMSRLSCGHFPRFACQFPPPESAIYITRRLTFLLPLICRVIVP